MIQGTYDISVNTPKHHKRGLLTLQETAEALNIEINLTGFESLIFKGKQEDRNFSFADICEFPGLGSIKFQAQGDVWGNSLSLILDSDAGKIEIAGTRLSGVAGDTKSSHDYLMAASRADFSQEDNTMYSGLYADGA